MLDIVHRIEGVLGLVAGVENKAGVGIVLGPAAYEEPWKRAGNPDIISMMGTHVEAARLNWY
jgi:hypothetical protein